MAHFMRSVVDEDTSGRLEDAGADATSYELVKDWIEKREVKLLARHGGAGKDFNAMVYGMSEAASPEPGLTQPEPPPATPLAASSHAAPSPEAYDGTRAADPWACSADP